jgi:hypothetical protein
MGLNTDGTTSAKQILGLLKIQSVIETVIASTVTVATELTIRWNFITGVHDLKSAGQLSLSLLENILCSMCCMYLSRIQLSQLGPVTEVQMVATRMVCLYMVEERVNKFPETLRFPRRAGIR